MDLMKISGQGQMATTGTQGVVPWETIIQTFLDTRRTDSTRKTYEPIVRAMAQDLGGVGPLEVGADMVAAWARTVRESVEAEEISPNTGKRKIMTAKSFFNFAHSVQQSTLNKARRKIVLPSLEDQVTKPFQTLNGAEEKLLLDAVPDNHRAMVATMLYAGLRVSEACKLRGPDYYTDSHGQRWLLIRGAKGGRSRKVPVGDTLRAHLGEPNGKTGPLFQSRQGDGHYSRSRLFQIVQSTIEDAEIGRRISPHSLRHTAAMRWIMSDGVPLSLVQNWLGHKSLATTQKYLDHVNEIESHSYMR